MFTTLPWVEVKDDGGQLTANASGRGAAVLLTHGCQLDKVGRSGRPGPQRLVFAPIHSLSSADLGSDYERRLRRRDLHPAEAVLLDFGSSREEAVAFLSEAYMVPSSYFALELHDYGGHEGADPRDPNHATPTRADSRSHTMDDEELALLHRKSAYFWARADIRPS